MANLALNAKTMTAIWAGLSLLALAVFVMGFLSGAYWSDITGQDAVTAAVAEPPETSAPPAPEPTAQAEPQKPADPEPAVSEPEPEETPSTPSPSPTPQAAQKPPAEPEQVAAKPPVSQAEPQAPKTVRQSPEPQAAPKPEPKAAPVLQGEVFFVQVASFRSLERAADMYAELAAKGHDASVFTVFDNDDQPWYVLRIGEYATREQAEAAGAEYRIREGASFTVRGFEAALLRERTIPTESLPLEAER